MKETVSCLNLTNCLPVNLVIRVPANSTDPADGFINPPRHLSSVDLPDPDGPTTATASPSRIETLRPLSATTLPSSAFDSYM